MAPEADETAAIDPEQDDQSPEEEPTTEAEIKERYGTPQNPAPGYEWKYNAEYGYYYPVRIEPKEVNEARGG